MKLHSLMILLIIIGSLLPAFLINKILKKKLRPQGSVIRFLVYMVSSLALVFIYVFLVVSIVAHLFPLE
jgi:hypothetical protein